MSNSGDFFPELGESPSYDSLPPDVFRITPMDEEFGHGYPYGTLRVATAMEEEFGTSDPSVITKMDIEFGTADAKIRRHRERRQ